MKHRRLSLVLLAALVLTAGACGRSQPPQTPSPSPVITSSPTPSVDPSEEALYAEAERVYLAYMATRETYVSTGDYSVFPEDAFAELLSPDYLLKVRAVFDLEKEHGWQLLGGAPNETVEPAPSIGKDGSVVAITTCSDNRDRIVVNSAGEQSPGKLVIGPYFFKYFDGRLKISGSDVREAEACPIG